MNLLLYPTNNMIPSYASKNTKFENDNTAFPGSRQTLKTTIVGIPRLRTVRSWRKEKYSAVKLVMKNDSTLRKIYFLYYEYYLLNM